MSGDEKRNSPDPQRIAYAARSFLLAADRAHELRPLPSGASQMLIVPGAVCLAFSAELYLKALTILEGGQRKNTHELAELFGKISPASREELRTSLSVSEEAMKANLAEASNTFDEWRYFYESESDVLALDLDFMRRLIGALGAIVTERLKDRHHMADEVPR